MYEIDINQLEMDQPHWLSGIRDEAAATRREQTVDRSRDRLRARSRELAEQRRAKRALRLIVKPKQSDE